MAIPEKLDALRDTHPDCRLAAFADISSQMVLVSSSGKKPPQETLDRLSAEAAYVLGGPITQLVNQDTQTAHHAVVATPTDLTLFLRSTNDATDGLCCVCDIDIDIDALIASAQRCLEQISTGDTE